MANVQLTNAQDYSVKNMIFSKPEVGTVPDSNPPVKYRRVKIGTKYPDGSTGDLIISTPRVWSFGVQESTEIGTGKVNGHSFPISLWSRDGPTEEESRFIDTFNAIVENAKKYILDHKDDLEKYDLEESDLKKFNPMYWKREKGKIVEGKGPMLYPKLMESKKKGTITSIFEDYRSGEDIDALSLMNKGCYTVAAIKLESVFIGGRISLQVKLYEASVEQQDNSRKRLLPRPQAIEQVIMPSSSKQSSSSSDEDNDEERKDKKESESESESDSEKGSLKNDSDDESESQPKSLPVENEPKKVVRRKVVGKK
jgi:hypothetical protein